MELSKTKLIEILRKEREIILMEFEQSVKKQKEETITAIREEVKTSFKNEINNISTQIEDVLLQVQQNIYEDMLRAVSALEDDKYRGYLVQVSKDF